MTLVSVLMPTWQGERFVAEALDGILAQTHRPLEVIVADDASTDATAAIVARYAAAHPQLVRLVAGAERRGPCHRRNVALDHARGDVLAWHDQDDVWLADKLVRQVAVLEDRPEVGLVYCDWEEFAHPDPAPLPRAWPHHAARGDILGDLVVEGCFMCSSTMIVRRAALDRRGLRFREADFSFGDDHFMWLAVALDWQAERIDEVLVRYRRHDRNESARRPGENFHRRRIALLDELVATFPDARDRIGRRWREGRARHFVRAARFDAAHGRPVAAARALASAARADPAVLAERIAGELRRVPSGR